MKMSNENCTLNHHRYNLTTSLSCSENRLISCLYEFNFNS